MPTQGVLCTEKSLILIVHLNRRQTTNRVKCAEKAHLAQIKPSLNQRFMCFHFRRRQKTTSLPPIEVVNLYICCICNSFPLSCSTVNLAPFRMEAEAELEPIKARFIARFLQVSTLNCTNTKSLIEPVKNDMS